MTSHYSMCRRAFAGKRKIFHCFNFSFDGSFNSIVFESLRATMITRSMKRPNNGSEVKSAVIAKGKRLKVEKMESSISEEEPKQVEKLKSNDINIKIKTPLESNCVRVNRKLIGAHVSIAGGLRNAPINAASIGAKSFALFLRSQRQWNCKPLDESIAEQFRKECEVHGYTQDAILPHGSYLLNCGAPNAATLDKSRAALVDELQRCEQLGLSLYNFHPGSTCGEISIDECLDRIGETINSAHEKTKYVITVVENMSRQGHTVGGDFKELRGIIDRVRNKSRVGICIDTCHAFAAGYDLSTEIGFNKMMQEFETVVGLNYLKALHLNDSKGKVGCHLDRHENIGKGYIGKDAFKRIINDPRFNNIPMILETPFESDETYSKEIKLLYSLEDL